MKKIISQATYSFAVKMWTVYLVFQVLGVILNVHQMAVCSDNLTPREHFNLVEIMLDVYVTCLPAILQVMSLENVYFTIPIVVSVIVHIVANMFLDSTKENYRLGQAWIMGAGFLSEMAYRCLNY